MVESNMANFLQNTNAPLVASGARALLKFDDQLLFFANSVNWHIVHNQFDVLTVDSSIPEEIVPTHVMVELTCRTFRVPDLTATKLQIEPHMMDTLTHRYLEIVVEDRQSGATILKIPRAVMTSRTGGTGARSLMTETWSFRGIGFLDETYPSGITVKPKKPNTKKHDSAFKV